MLLLRVLNSDNDKSLVPSINFIYGDDNIDIINEIQVMNIEKCEGEFIISGNDYLIYFYLPLILSNSYIAIEK